MNFLKKIFNCRRGYHEVARSYLNVSGKQFTEFQPIGGGAITYFRCAHCLGLFGISGHVEDVPKKRAIALEPSKMSEPILMALVKEPWWPTCCPPEPWPDPPPYSEAADSAKLCEDLKTAAAAWEAEKASQGIDPTTAQLPKPKKTPPCPQVPEPRRDPLWDVVIRAKDIIDDLKAQRAESAERQKVKDKVFSSVAQMISLLGTCCRLKVGCVLLTFEGKVAGMGYNGSGPGMPHCAPDTCNETCRCARTVHAEINALSNCSGTPHTAYVTHEPCCACAKELVLAGVRRVVYTEVYTSIAEAERVARQEWIDHYGVKWEHLTPSTQAQEQP